MNDATNERQRRHVTAELQKFGFGRFHWVDSVLNPLVPSGNGINQTASLVPRKELSLT